MFGLTHIDMSNNELTSLPEEIGSLSLLQELHLSSNRLEKLPKEIGHLSSLQRLCLDNNQLKTQSKEIENLYKNQIFVIYFKGNPLIEHSDESVLGLQDLNRIFAQQIMPKEYDMYSISSELVYRELNTHALHWNINMIKSLNRINEILPGVLMILSSKSLKNLGDIIILLHVIHER